jgi:16S rRNA (cytosine1402-N4)-methyltransferase
MEIVHSPVLLKETLDLLCPSELMVDATLGEGGHSYAFLERFPELRIIGLDADKDIQGIARERLKGFGDRMEFRNVWSHDFFAATDEEPDAILMDLGISSYHYEKGERGFSFLKDESLDMRLDPNRNAPASEILNKLSEKDLADLLYYNAEERYSRRIARNIVEERSRAKILSTKVLADIVFRSVPVQYRYGAVHPATKTFQALRIAVNGELERLPELLENAFKSLKFGGRMGVISFHSLEDRIVKRFFREKEKSTPIHKKGEQGELKFNVKKGIAPSDEEIRCNPRSRSARLRIGVKS